MEISNGAGMPNIRGRVNVRGLVGNFCDDENRLGSGATRHVAHRHDMEREREIEIERWYMTNFITCEN